MVYRGVHRVVGRHIGRCTPYPPWKVHPPTHHGRYTLLPTMGGTPSAHSPLLLLRVRALLRRVIPVLP